MGYEDSTYDDDSDSMDDDDDDSYDVAHITAYNTVYDTKGTKIIILQLLCLAMGMVSLTHIIIEAILKKKKRNSCVARVCNT